MNLLEAPKSLITSACEFPLEYRNKILKLSLAITQTPNQDRTKIINKICQETNISLENLYNILGVYIAVIKLFLEVNDKDFNNRLLEIGFTDKFIENLPLISNREDVVNNILNVCHTDFGKLSYLKWRIDISLINSTLVKKVPTSVIICFSLENGRKITVEVDGRMFHKLRFNIALLLNELTAIKSQLINK